MSKDLLDFIDFERYDIVDKKGNIYTTEELEKFPKLKPLLDVAQEFYHTHKLSQVLSLSKFSLKTQQGGVYDINYLDFKINLNPKKIVFQEYFTLEHINSDLSFIEKNEINLGVSNDYSDSTPQALKTKKEYVVNPSKKEKISKKERNELETYAKWETLKYALHDQMIDDEEQEKQYAQIVKFYQQELAALTPEALNQNKNELPLWLASLLFNSAMRGLQRVARYAQLAENSPVWAVEVKKEDISFEELVFMDAAYGLCHESLIRSFEKIKQIKNLADSHTNDMLGNIRYLSGYRSSSANLGSLERIIAYAYVSSNPNFLLKGAFGALAREKGVIERIKKTHFWTSLEGKSYQSTAKFVEAVSLSEDSSGVKYQDLLSELKIQADKDRLEKSIAKPFEFVNHNSQAKTLKI